MFNELLGLACLLQELAAQADMIEALRAELACASEAPGAAQASAAAAAAAEAALAGKEDELKRFKLQLVKAKKLRAQDAERWVCGVGGGGAIHTGCLLHCGGSGRSDACRSSLHQYL
jgi:hypothetical protein